jgi:hypothetical protein
VIPFLAQETIEKTVWYPTILGILVTVFAIALFCGSIYLLLGTNLGARLGFLVAFTGLMAFMVILTTLWITTSSPLNTLKGRIPSWKAQQVVDEPSKANIEAVRDIAKKSNEVSAVEAANVKAAVDETLVRASEAAHGEPPPQKFAEFGDVTEYKVNATYETGGSKPNPLDFELTHTPLYAVVEFCEVREVEPVFGVPPPEPECASGDSSRYLVLERDLGSLRIPPIVAWISSILLFGLGLLALHWREKDEQAAKQPTTLTPAPSQA